MNTPKFMTSFEKPEKFIDLGTGYWYYNYNITSEEVLAEVQEPNQESQAAELKTQYSYLQTRINGKPDYSKCVLAIIREFVDESQEFDLINSANKALIERSVPTNEYLEYLQLLDTIKANIKEDFAE